MPDVTLISGPPRQPAPTTVVRVARVFNAENLAITNGRVFLTGSKGVYEVVKEEKEDSGYQLLEIPVRVDRTSDQWVRNGIASDGSRLYLACAHVHDSRLPFARGLFDNIPDIEQTLPGLSKLMLAQLLCRVDSYIVAADLNQSDGAELAFTRILASSRGTFFANGLDVAEDGSVYVANSHPGLTGGIYRICPGHSTPELCHQCIGCSPNGVRIEGKNNLYYTGLQIWPYPAAVLRQVNLAPTNSSANASRLLVSRTASLFDDFDLLEDGFVVAEFASWRRSPFAVGGLLFFSRAGDLLNEVRTGDLVHPSSVRVCRRTGGSVAAGEILVTEKSGHRLLAVRQATAQGASTPE